jgi:hypothetical protein
MGMELMHAPFPSISRNDSVYSALYSKVLDGKVFCPKIQNSLTNPHDSFPISILHKCTRFFLRANGLISIRRYLFGMAIKNLFYLEYISCTHDGCAPLLLCPVHFISIKSSFHVKNARIICV